MASPKDEFAEFEQDEGASSQTLGDPSSIDYPIPPKNQSLDQLDRTGLIGRAIDQAKDKNHLGAIRTLENASSQFPKDAEIKTRIGLEYLKLRKEKEALPHFKEAAILAPKYIPPYLEMAKIYKNRKNSFELRTLYQDLIERVGPKKEFITELCELTTLDAQYSLSLNYCQQGIRKDPSEPRNHVFLGVTYKFTDKPEIALKTLTKAANTFGGSELAQVTLAEHYLSQKNYISAHLYYSRATAADPKSYNSWLGYAKTALEIQKFAEARRGYDNACEIDRRALIPIRKAISDLRVLKANDQIPLFNDTLEKCQRLPLQSK